MSVEIPPYSRKPITLPDGTAVIGWSGPATPTRPRCRCSHGPSTHTGGYGQCWISVCCCETYRDPQESKQ